MKKNENNEEELLKLLSSFIDDERLTKSAVTLYKSKSDSNEHLNPNCIYSSNYGSKNTNFEPRSSREINFISLIAISFIYSYSGAPSICDWCYSAWLDVTLSESEQESLSLALNHRLETPAKEEKIAILVESLNGGGDLDFAELLEVTSLIIADQRRLKAQRSIENRVSRSISGELAVANRLRQKIENLATLSIKPLEFSEIREDLTFSKALSKALLKDSDLKEFFHEDIDLEAVNDLLKGKWLESINLTSEARRKILVDYLFELLTVGDGETASKIGWLRTITKLIENRVNLWEQELEKILKAEEIFFLLDKGNYASQRLTDLTAFFEIAYPFHELEDRFIYILPSLWREKLRYLINDAQKGYYYPNDDIGNYSVILPSDLSAEEIKTLLTLWTPESNSLYSNPVHAYNASKKI